MRRLLLSLAFVSALAFAQHEPASAAAGEHKSAAAGEKHEEEPNILWRWLNFAILAGGLGYLIAKNAPAFFKSRTAEIQRGIADATEMRQKADERAAAMDKRMANLEAEIADLRTHAKSEIVAEANRVGIETVELLAKIQAHAEREIASAAKGATLQLKAYSAKLALDLAEEKLRGRMTPATDRDLIGEFLKGLKN
jgi:F0F1-type ATP synthase membrane subunit b/b'